MKPSQRIWVVPGIYGHNCTGKIASCHEQTDLALVAKLRGNLRWVETEPRVAGIMGWHWPSFVGVVVGGLGDADRGCCVSTSSALGGADGAQSACFVYTCRRLMFERNARTHWHPLCWHNAPSVPHEKPAADCNFIH